MSDDRWRDDATLARRVVREGLVAMKDADGVVTKRIGKLSVLSDAEAQGFKDFQTRIEAYTRLEEPEHPLCLGVFGPPGSGKSFAVKQILASLNRTLRVINLSQLEGPGDLSSALAEVARWSAGQTPVAFFDEFDSSLAGNRLGWLQWLLAPMQDGVVVHHGHAIEMKRAVFVFAGGTADTFEEFPQVHDGYFRGAKGPDFISRLRGHLNVLGVNEWPYRRVRRATVVRLAIEQVAPHLLDGERRLPAAAMSDEFLDRVLAVGRFIHGARSVEALVETATRPDESEFSDKTLPADELLGTLVDAGPLGGLAIALSAGGARRDGNAGDYDSDLEDAWTLVATRLMELGAGLAYGGDLRSKGFTRRLLAAVSRLPKPLGGGGQWKMGPAGPPAPGRVMCYQSRREADAKTETDAEAESTPPEAIDARPMPEVAAGDLDVLWPAQGNDTGGSDRPTGSSDGGPARPDHRERLARALALFRMRAEIARLTDARLAFGGRTSGSSGRFPGVAEEVMLSLAAGSAIYLCGAFHGATEVVGQLLGLGFPWFEVPDCLRVAAGEPGAGTFEAVAEAWGDRFQLPHRHDLPRDYPGFVAFLRDHALGGPGWPDNGLTPPENRALFRSKDPEEITRLVTKGLRLRFGGVV